MGKIIVNYGGGETEIKKTTQECLEAYGLSGLIEKGRKIIIKPNLVNNTKASQGATTHVEVVEGIIEYLLKFGHRDIEILESSWVGGNVNDAYKICDYGKLSGNYHIPLLNVLKQGFKTLKYNGIKVEICTKVLGDAFLINVPVMKAHCQTQITCCLKNLKGLISNEDKRRFHTLGLHEPIAALSALVKIDFNVVDAICGDLTFEEGGNPVDTKMIIAGEDPVLIDTFAAEFMGYNPRAIRYIALAERHGVGDFFSDKAEVVELNADKKPGLDIKASSTAASLSKYIDEQNACSACYSALIHALYRADKAALKRFEKNKIAIGQGFKGVKGDGMGFGNCASQQKECVRGCPPKAIDMLKKLT